LQAGSQLFNEPVGEVRGSRKRRADFAGCEKRRSPAVAPARTWNRRAHAGDVSVNILKRRGDAKIVTLQK